VHTALPAGTIGGQGIQPAACALSIAPLLDFVEFRLHKILHQAGCLFLLFFPAAPPARCDGLINPFPLYQPSETGRANSEHFERKGFVSALSNLTAVPCRESLDLILSQ